MKKLEEKQVKLKNKLMKAKKKKIYLQAKKRYLKTIVGNSDRPRLSIFRSHKHIYAQIINDQNGHTFCLASTLSKNLNSEKHSTATKEMSFKVGQKIGELAKNKNVKQVVFDCGKRAYHGRIQSLAEGARLTGLLF
jgi:large subunit ribosomal protein L18